MADIGVRVLKQHLSEYLDRAERGELIRVTDRGRPKAVLGPLPGRERVDEVTCEAAAGIAELTGARTLDALHLAAAQRVGGTAVGFVTFDVRQAQAARTLGMTVLPA